MLHSGVSPCVVSGAPHVQVGAEIVRKALSYPLRLIANNAGVNGSVVQQRVLENLDQSIGYNAATDKYEDLMAAGIIDPTKVPRPHTLYHLRLQAQPPCCRTRPAFAFELVRQKDICHYLICLLHLSAHIVNTLIAVGA